MVDISRHPETVSLVVEIASEVSRGEGERREGVGVLAQLSSNNNLDLTSSLLTSKLDTLLPAMQREFKQASMSAPVQVPNPKSKLDWPDTVFIVSWTSVPTHDLPCDAYIAFCDLP